MVTPKKGDDPKDKKPAADKAPKEKKPAADKAAKEKKPAAEKAAKEKKPAADKAAKEKKPAAVKKPDAVKVAKDKKPTAVKAAKKPAKVVKGKQPAKKGSKGKKPALKGPKGKEALVSQKVKGKKALENLAKRKKIHHVITLKPGVVRFGIAKKEVVRKIMNPKQPYVKKVIRGKRVIPSKKVHAVKAKAKKTPVAEVVTTPVTDEAAKEAAPGAVKEKKAPTGEKKKTARKVPSKKPPRYYPIAIPQKKRFAEKKRRTKATLKKSLTPGTICIVVSGPHKGKRVVFLKQLNSGLCLITGPFIFNRVPLRRINQIYLIATSTKINLTENFKLSKRINDGYFRYVKTSPTSEKAEKPKKSAGKHSERRVNKHKPTRQRKIDQKIVDLQVLKAMRHFSKKSEFIYAYMKSKFSLQNHQYPHLIKF